MPADLPTLNPDDIRNWLRQQIPVSDFQDRKVLLLVPDSTR